jgi:hypothetical protein
MSSVAFGALSTRRELSDSGKSTSVQPPGVSSYVDILAGLVPAEVLAINSIVVAAITSGAAHGPATPADTNTYRWMFGLLAGLAAVLFVLGRRPAPSSAQARAQAGPAAVRWENWEWQDLLRMAVPPAAYACWTMVEPTGVWSAVVPGMSSGLRLLIPLVGFTTLAAVTKALASHADKKPSPAQRRAAATPHPAPPSAPRLALDLAPRPASAQPVMPAATPAKPLAPENETVQAPNSTNNTNNNENQNDTDITGAEIAESVPPWVY